jgi:protein-tyrosine phosphatase
MGIRYVKFGLMDNADNPDYMKYGAVLTLETMLQKGERVLVHCAAGLSRSVYTACQAVANIENRHVGEVFEELRAIHPFAMMGPLFNGAPNPLTEQYALQEKQAENQEVA